LLASGGGRATASGVSPRRVRGGRHKPEAQNRGAETPGTELMKQGVRRRGATEARGQVSGSYGSAPPRVVRCDSGATPFQAVTRGHRGGAESKPWVGFEEEEEESSSKRPGPPIVTHGGSGAGRFLRRRRNVAWVYAKVAAAVAYPSLANDGDLNKKVVRQRRGLKYPGFRSRYARRICCMCCREDRLRDASGLQRR
jgi:hypothetical protein